MAFLERVKTFFEVNQKALRFLALFALIFAVCYFIFGIAEGVRNGIIKPYTVLIAKAIAVVVNLFGASAITDGTTVQSGTFSLNIAMGCDGVEATCLFLAGVLAFPTTWRARFIGLAIGIPIIQVINLARLVGLYYAGIYLPSLIEQIHVYIAQSIVILLSTVVLIYWLERIAVPSRTA